MITDARSKLAGQPLDDRASGFGNAPSDVRILLIGSPITATSAQRGRLVRRDFQMRSHCIVELLSADVHILHKKCFTALGDHDGRRGRAQSNKHGPLALVAISAELFDVAP